MCSQKECLIKFETRWLQEIPFSKELTDIYCALGLLFESKICNNNSNNNINNKWNAFSRYQLLQTYSNWKNDRRNLSWEIFLLIGRLRVIYMIVCWSFVKEALAVSFECTRSWPSETTDTYTSGLDLHNVFIESYIIYDSSNIKAI